MAGTTGNKKKLDFDCTLFDLMNQDKLEEYYVMYDDIADELIFKFVQPEHPTAYHYLNEHMAAIIEEETNRMVGLALCYFKEDVLPKSNAASAWSKQVEKALTRQYISVTSEMKRNAPPSKQQINKQQQIDNLYNSFLETLDWNGRQKTPCLSN